MFRRLTAFLLTTSITGAVTGAAVVRAAARTSPPASGGTWSARAAAAYLDYRQSWWQAWSHSARDHGTVCVSCHTVLPYALARPELGAALHDTVETASERKLMADVERRVRGWAEMEPYYGGVGKSGGEEKAIESRGTESVLNALILAERDARANSVSADSRTAFANMWALQLQSGANAGAWSWLNFELEPWEAPPSTYFGAALAAIAVGSEPGGYAQSADIRHNVQQLVAYLRANINAPFMDRVMRRDDPALFRRAMLLWASTRLPALASPAEQREMMRALYDAQRSDGGWSLSSLGKHWRRFDGTPLPTASDGYATGLIAYALEQAGIDASEPHLARALGWLAQNQDRATGMWPAASLNKARDPDSDPAKFMSDASTAFAVLALTNRSTP
jgi:squalene-hopene/tetraprenyl-beta-curcumene cyclase